jgi:filamentous hemagglutinin
MTRFSFLIRLLMAVSLFVLAVQPASAHVPFPANREDTLMQTRLGDGLFEQRLIREAVIERTGKRLIDGATSDEALFRQLMENAAGSKEALNLSLGIGLTAEQVAALTHDLVWLEEKEIGGQQVLVPVLYLAQAEGRLAPNGALIEGQNLNVIAGESLHSIGTLKAGENLNLVAGNVVNGGLIEAGQSLDILAADSIRNERGGILAAGGDVSLTAVTGDVVNERTITTVQMEDARLQFRNDIANEGARIEAGGNLSINAGQNILNLGSAISAGGDVTLAAGQDVRFESQAEVDTYRYSSKRQSGTIDSVRQYAASVEAGGNLQVQAGNELTVMASDIAAGRDVYLVAGNNVVVASAADEKHEFYRQNTGGVKTTHQEDETTQRQSRIGAGNDLTIVSGSNLIVSASQLEAGNDATLVAAENLALLAANDEQYYFHEEKKKKSFGRGSIKSDEITDITAVGSAITAGNDVTLISDGSQLYQTASLDAGNDLSLLSGDEIVFEATKDVHQESHQKSKTGWVKAKAKGKGWTDETLRQSHLIAEGELFIDAPGGIRIDVKDAANQASDLKVLQAVADAGIGTNELNEAGVHDLIAAMVKADPGLAWLEEMEQRGDVDWRKVKEIHDYWSYSHSGLSPAGGAILSLIVTVATYGYGADLLATSTGSMTQAHAVAAATAAGTAGTATTGALATGVLTATQEAIANTLLSSMASNAAVGLVNGQGDLGAALEAAFSEDALKGYLTAAATAGLTQAYFNDWTGVQFDQKTGMLSGKNFTSLERIGRVAAHQMLQSGTQAAVDRLLGGEGNFADAMKTAILNTAAAAGFNLTGDLAENLGLQNGDPQKALLHAVVGGMLAEASGGDFKTGAIAAGANELLANYLGDIVKAMPVEDKQAWELTGSRIIGILAVSLQDGGASQQEVDLASWVAFNATAYNRGLHPLEDKKLKELVADQAEDFCKGRGDPTCVRKASDTLFYYLALVASGEVDITDAAMLNAFVQQVENTANNPGSNGEQGGSKRVLDLLTIARQELLSLPEFGQPIVYPDGTVALDKEGNPQTYFSVTEEQRQDRWLNSRYDLFGLSGSQNLDFSLGWKNAEILDWLNQQAGSGAVEPACPECFWIGARLGAEVKSLAGILKSVIKSEGEKTPGLIAKALPNVPGRVQSRINLENEAWSHVVNRHFNQHVNASQFTVTQSELRAILQDKEVVGARIAKVISRGEKGPGYVREVDVGRAIGVDKFTGSVTSRITVMTDKKGNLITAFPGVLE